MSQADWDRLQYYFRRVKLFTIGQCELKVHPLAYFRIQLQTSALFPSLRHLYYNMGGKSYPISRLSPIFLLSPLLDSLELFNFNGKENTIVGPFLTLRCSIGSSFLMDGCQRIFFCPLQAPPISRAFRCLFHGRF